MRALLTQRISGWPQAFRLLLNVYVVIFKHFQIFFLSSLNDRFTFLVLLTEKRLTMFLNFLLTSMFYVILVAKYSSGLCLLDINVRMKRLNFSRRHELIKSFFPLLFCGVNVFLYPNSVFKISQSLFCFKLKFTLLVVLSCSSLFYQYIGFTFKLIKLLVVGLELF